MLLPRHRIASPLRENCVLLSLSLSRRRSRAHSRTNARHAAMELTSPLTTHLGLRQADFHFHFPLDPASAFWCSDSLTLTHPLERSRFLFRLSSCEGCLLVWRVRLLLQSANTHTHRHSLFSAIQQFFPHHFFFCYLYFRALSRMFAACKEWQ